MYETSVKTVNFTTEEQKKQFSDFVEKTVPQILEQVGYSELFGHEINSKNDEYFNKDVFDALMFKFLIANDFKLEESKQQLSKTLKWRKEFNPLKAAFIEEHDPKFKLLGVLTNYPSAAPNTKIITWNLYGASNNAKEFFKDLNKFLRYRVGLMEKCIALLDFTDPTNNFITQIHDYKGVSFLKLDPDIKAGSKATIEIFQSYYPELLNKKFFINIPKVLYWIYEFIKKLLPGKTVDKFIMLSDSKSLINYLGSEIPASYGGKGVDIYKQNVSEINQSNYVSHILEQDEINQVE